MRRLFTPATILFLVGCSASPSGGGDPGGGNGTDRLTATIDGQAFTATLVQANPVATTPGSLSFLGVQTVGSTARSINIILAFIPGTGTYPLGMNIGSSPGGTVSMALGTTSYTTPLSGAAGTITITTLSNSRVAGTFSFTATAVAGAGASTVTNGVFDVPRSAGYVAPTADNAGSTLTAGINGTPQVGATITGLGGGTSTRVVGAMNLEYSISITASPVTAPTSGALTGSVVPQRRISITRVGTAQSWGGAGNDVGTLAITSISPTRLAGTFSGTLAPNAQTTGSLTVTNGAFSVRTP